VFFDGCQFHDVSLIGFDFAVNVERTRGDLNFPKFQAVFVGSELADLVLDFQ